MDGRSQPIKVMIFGNEYSIKGDADPGYVNKLAKFVDEKMLELTGGRTTSATVQLAVLAAFNIADEYFQMKEEIKKLKENSTDLTGLDKKIADLIQLIDNAVD